MEQENDNYNSSNARRGIVQEDNDKDTTAANDDDNDDDGNEDDIPDEKSSNANNNDASAVVVDATTTTTTTTNSHSEEEQLVVDVESDRRTAESIAREDFRAKRNRTRRSTNSSSSTSSGQELPLTFSSNTNTSTSTSHELLPKQRHRKRRSRRTSPPSPTPEKSTNISNRQATTTIATTKTSSTSIPVGALFVTNEYPSSTQNITRHNDNHDYDEENESDNNGPMGNNHGNNNSNNNNNIYDEEEAVLLEATLVPDQQQQQPQQQPQSQQSTYNHSHNNTDENDMPTTTAASCVVEAEHLVCAFSHKQLYLVITGCIITAILTALAIYLGVRLTSNNNDGSGTRSDSNATQTPYATTMAQSTLDTIRQRGTLNCGVWEESLNFFSITGIFNKPEDQVDFVLCRAFAAAILGNASQHNIVLTSQWNHLEQLTTNNIDISISHTDTGIQSDVFEEPLNTGFTFTVPYIYTDFVYGGLPEYVACADDNMNARGNCSGIRICTNDESAYFDSIANKLPERYLVKKNDTLGIVLGFVTGECNVLPSENNGIMEYGLDMLGYKGRYARGTTPFQKDVVAVATRDADVAFSDFINMILMGLFAAEQANITRNNAEEMLKRATILGPELADAVAAVGNYAEVYEVGVSPLLKRDSWNFINNGTTGLLFSMPLGKARNLGPGPVEGGTIERIWARSNRKLYCGIRTGRPGFASWDSSTERYVGMDVEFCTAVAAGVLEGEAEGVEFIPVSDEADGYRKLQEGTVDILAGFTWTVVNDYEEPTTQEGYFFSQPYFYKPSVDTMWVRESQNASTYNFLSDKGDNLCLVTRQNDPQFSSFVYWIVGAIFYAEEEGISQANANNMPDVNLFGSDFRKMFRDAVFFTGRYDEIYERNLGDIFLERGRNAVNSVYDPGPQIYVPPGFFAPH